MEDKYVDFGGFVFNRNKNGGIELNGDDGDITHKYLLLDQNIRSGSISAMSSCIMEYFLEIKKSRKEWIKDTRIHNVNWGEKKEIKSKDFNYSILSKYLREKLKFNPSDFNFPPLECNWLDSSNELSVNFHNVGTDVNSLLVIADGIPKEQFGEKYPIHPKLDREGKFFSTFQPQLISRVINNRLKLINNSHLVLTQEWFFEFRSLVIDTISLLDITLNQLYIKAEFDPLPDWVFDKTKLGERYGRRLNDKLRWVRLISGKNLDIETEKNSLDELRKIRNHLNHFDPPSFVMTVEEVTNWLNYILDIGVILFKIRITLGLKMSAMLINFQLQRNAIFNPKKEFKNRKSLTENAGYKSSIWPNEKG